MTTEQQPQQQQLKSSEESTNNDNKMIVISSKSRGCGGSGVPSLPALYFLHLQTTSASSSYARSPISTVVVGVNNDNSEIHHPYQFYDGPRSTPSTTPPASSAALVRTTMTTSSKTITSDITSLQQLPSELIHKCLAKYADWGTLAKLACVQSSWKNILDDAVNYGGNSSKWELAQALMEGKKKHGLVRHPKRAISYLMDLTAISSTKENDGEEEVDVVEIVRRMEEEEEEEERRKKAEEEEGEEIVDAFTTPVDNDNDNDDVDGQCSSNYAPAAMRMLASCYLTGDGVSKSNPVGIAWLKHAAKGRGGGKTETDVLEAAHDLAVLYETGAYDEPVDVIAAAKWFLHAAEHGHVEAMAEYGLCLELGCGVDQNDEEALRWYIKAANAGHAVANYSVGEAFEEARGVPQSDEEACLWYYKAAEIGDEDSKKALRRLHDIARIVLPRGWQGIVLNA